MKSSNQRPSKRSSYLLFAAIGILALVTVSGATLSGRARSQTAPPTFQEAEPPSPQTEPASPQQTESASPAQTEQLATPQAEAAQSQQTESASPQQTTETQQLRTERSDATAGRNLAMQPEAFRLSLNLGRRFSGGREVSTLSGTLTTPGEQQAIRIVRSQSDRGERVEIAINGAPPSLTWSSDEGAMSSGRAPSQTERTMIERLVLDSVDQFAQAQLRGASYYTVERNSRPAGANDDYAGPVWNIVRVDDPETDEQKRPESRWRLYYINTTTRLIDKIVSQARGETIEAQISGWTDVAGEKVPAEINWTRQGQTVMQFRLSNFSHAQ